MSQSRWPRGLGRSGTQKQLMLREGVFTPGSGTARAAAAATSASTSARRAERLTSAILYRCAMPAHEILVWSDYIYPFCRLGQPLAEWLRRRFDAEVTWLPFDLHPEYPERGLPRGELLARHGSFEERLRDRFAEEGLEYTPNPDVVPRSLTALRLTELARDLGRHDELHDRLM